MFPDKLLLDHTPTMTLPNRSKDDLTEEELKGMEEYKKNLTSLTSDRLELLTDYLIRTMQTQETN